tara:strand:- start:1563 stop:2234 length:672 start_codon:yes stop_codon:yes gene_type:complete
VTELSQTLGELSGSLIVIIVNFLVAGGGFGLSIRFCAPENNPFADSFWRGVVRSTLFGVFALIALFASFYLGCFGILIWFVLFFIGMRMVFECGAIRTVLIVIVFLILMSLLNYSIAMISSKLSKDPPPTTNPANNKNFPGREQEWTSKSLTKWKRSGGTAQNALKLFGKPDSTKAIGPASWEWTYNNMKIYLKPGLLGKGRKHTSITFTIKDGKVDMLQVAR